MVCTPAISSHSLGRAWVHSIKPKLDQAAKYGFDIEMFYEDLYYVAKSLPGGANPQNHLEAARLIHSMCRERDINVICIQPFMHYEGLRDRQRHLQRIEEMKLWIQMANILQTKIISIPSTCLSKDEVSGDMELIVQDMQEVADLAASSGVQIAYEALAWGTYVDTWDKAWEVVERVDRPNFKICLDTFNIAARVYADPTAASRKNPNADEDMRRSLDRLVQTIDPKKIAYAQVVDAEYLPEPLVQGHRFYNASQPPRMSWSRNCRLFYGEENIGGYLPIKAVLKAIIEGLGYDGCISAELFNLSLTDEDSLVPAHHAQRAATSWQKISDDFELLNGGRKHIATSLSRVRSKDSSRAQL